MPSRAIPVDQRGALLALDQHADGAVGQLQQLQHGGDHADVVERVAIGIVLGRIELRDEEDLLVGGHRASSAATDLSRPTNSGTIICGKTTMSRSGRTGKDLPFLGIGPGQALAFAAFWSLQLFFVRKGLATIRQLETWTAAPKILVCIALVWWAIDHAGGVGPIFAEPSAFGPGGAREGQFWTIFWPALTAMVGYWATLALNIPDFTRFARSQKDQAIGQAVALPPMMGLIALASVITTSATVAIYGRAIWDPVELAGTLAGPFVLLGLLVITIDTISCNIAANLVSSAYDFSSLWPGRISYRTGGTITAIVGILIMPWKLLATTGGYIFVWLAGYSALLGPIAGILIADYWLIRRTRLVVDDLYRDDGIYAYRSGWNPAAVIAFAAGILPNLPGFLKTAAPGAFAWIGPGWAAAYAYAWFIGLAVALALYSALMSIRTPRPARSPR
jgi:NCS1 family nucleobase:cation symporter-1